MDWNWQNILLIALAACFAVFALLEARSRRQTEHRLLRGMRALNGRMNDADSLRREETEALAQRLEQSDRTAEDRIRAMSESMDAAARQVQSLSHDLRESALSSRLASEKALSEALTRMQEGNEARLDEIRKTVDEKLQSTLQTRIGESFRQVSEQLERVYKSIGEMQTLAGDVGDLRRVLQNVTVRGAWGEARLEAILRENLTPEQYRMNTAVEPNASERVEFAICLPGKGDSPVLLPVDSKFPQADYDRLTAAVRDADAKAASEARSALKKALLTEAKRISSKYIRPPYTTDFAVMFLPTEGLFAELMQMDGTADEIERVCRVIPAGPSTFTALLTALQMGFRTLAVEQRSMEVWQLLGNVRREFRLFGDTLDRARRRLEQAGEELDGAATRTRSINRRLNDIEDNRFSAEGTGKEDEIQGG